MPIMFVNPAPRRNPIRGRRWRRRNPGTSQQEVARMMIAREKAQAKKAKRASRGASKKPKRRAAAKTTVEVKITTPRSKPKAKSSKKKSKSKSGRGRTGGSMAKKKRSAAQKAATRKMIAAAKKARKKKGGGSKRKSKGGKRKARKASSGGSRRKGKGRKAGGSRKGRRKGKGRKGSGTRFAGKGRRVRLSLTVNPSRRRRRRRNPARLLANPRRRRRRRNPARGGFRSNPRRRRRARRNPSMAGVGRELVSTVKQALPVALSLYVSRLASNKLGELAPQIGNTVGATYAKPALAGIVVVGAHFGTSMVRVLRPYRSGIMTGAAINLVDTLISAFAPQSVKDAFGLAGTDGIYDQALLADYVEGTGEYVDGLSDYVDGNDSSLGALQMDDGDFEGRMLSEGGAGAGNLNTGIFARHGW